MFQISIQYFLNLKNITIVYVEEIIKKNYNYLIRSIHDGKYQQNVHKSTLSPLDEKRRHLDKIESTFWNWNSNMYSFCKNLQKLHWLSF